MMGANICIQTVKGLRQTASDSLRRFNKHHATSRINDGWTVSVIFDCFKSQNSSTAATWSYTPAMPFISLKRAGNEKKGGNNGEFFVASNPAPKEPSPTPTKPRRIVHFCERWEWTAVSFRDGASKSARGVDASLPSLSPSHRVTRSVQKEKLLRCSSRFEKKFVKLFFPPFVYFAGLVKARSGWFCGRGRVANVDSKFTAGWYYDQVLDSASTC